MVRREHTPAYLRDMFCDALAHGAGHGRWWEWFVTEHADRFLWRERDGGRWLQLDAKGRARWVADQLAGSTAIVPEETLVRCGFEPGQSYAEIVRRVRREVDGEGQAVADRSPGDAAPVPLAVAIPRALMERLRTRSGREGLTLDEAVVRAVADWLDES